MQTTVFSSTHLYGERVRENQDALSIEGMGQPHVAPVWTH